MKGLLIVFWVCVLMGCSSQPISKVYPQDQRIVVKAGYSELGHKTLGDEFVFSLMLPEEEWVYDPKSEGPLMGFLRVYGRHSQRSLRIDWIWINRESAEMQKTIGGEDPYYLPWYSGVKGDGSRMPYTPTENQLRYGDWHRGGYSQRQFSQVIYKGRKSFYCVRTVTRRGEYTPPPKAYTAQYLAQVRQGIYGVFDTCPFRTVDNRDAYFKVSVSFNVTNDDIAANPNIVDTNLAALDEWLKPLWDSLEVMPQAYQFEAPLATNKQAQTD